MSERFTILSDQQIQDAMTTYLPDWHIENGGLKRDFKFRDFKEAFAFLIKIALAAEQLNHHPEIYNVYNQVTISGLCTHDASGAITNLDIELAKTISAFMPQTL